ncbi:MAG: NAD(P)-dependent oxidoreductase [Planctomycetia bacterium]|nr:NAD(P)-dependent oxidoreductase [Planctomycetia bacterium]
MDLKQRIGWIGTGVIGSACASRLLDAGFDLAVYTRTRAKAEPLLSRGAHWTSSARELASDSCVVFSCVGYPHDVREIFFGQEGILQAWQNSPEASQRVYIDMTTSSPELAREIAEAARANNFYALDAPVSGGDVGARNGTLSIMVGGDEHAAHTVTPILACLGNNIRVLGPAGSGQRAKATNQILIAGNMVGVCEALLYAYRAGLELEDVLASVSSGAAGSWSLSNLAPRILRGDFEPGFYVEHFIKDMGIALEDAQRLGLALPGLALVKQLYLALQAQGGGKLGTQALIQALARISNVDAFGA